MGKNQKLENDVDFEKYMTEFAVIGIGSMVVGIATGMIYIPVIVIIGWLVIRFGS